MREIDGFNPGQRAILSVKTASGCCNFMLVFKEHVLNLFRIAGFGQGQH